MKPSFITTLVAWVVAVTTLPFAHAQVDEKVGVQLDRFRLYIEGGAREGEVGFSNHLRVPVLVHTSFQDLAGKPIEYFEALPPLYRLDSGKTNRIRILTIGDLPQDKESVFYVTVTAIPATEGSGNQLRYSLGQRIRLYYRPVSITKNCAWVADQLQWKLEGKKLTVKNPTNMAMPMLDLQVDKKTVGANLLLPGQVRHYSLPESMKNTTFFYRYRSEYEGIKTKEVHLGVK